MVKEEKLPNNLVFIRRSYMQSTSNMSTRGSSGSIVSDYGLDDRGSIPDRGRGFFF
jgi:hypothetical protein